jgi:VIT1/CCC1 family predicted Fe2+/Mn2+ transporter
MASGEYVSIHSQADTEEVDLWLEQSELRTNDEGERQELAEIYFGRGLKPALAKEVTVQLMSHNALEAHARDELGITETLKARPAQAAIASALSFSVGAVVPLIAAAIASLLDIITFESATSLMCLAVLGALAARTSGASVAIGTIRTTVWGAFAMAVTAGVGALFGTIA